MARCSTALSSPSSSSSPPSSGPAKRWAADSSSSTPAVDVGRGGGDAGQQLALGSRPHRRRQLPVQPTQSLGRSRERVRPARGPQRRAQVVVGTGADQEPRSLLEVAADQRPPGPALGLGTDLGLEDPDAQPLRPQRMDGVPAAVVARHQGDAARERGEVDAAIEDGVEQGLVGTPDGGDHGHRAAARRWTGGPAPPRPGNRRRRGRVRACAARPAPATRQGRSPGGGVPRAGGRTTRARRRRTPARTRRCEIASPAPRRVTTERAAPGDRPGRGGHWWEAPPPGWPAARRRASRPGLRARRRARGRPGGERCAKRCRPRPRRARWGPRHRARRRGARRCAEHWPARRPGSDDRRRRHRNRASGRRPGAPGRSRRLPGPTATTCRSPARRRAPSRVDPTSGASAGAAGTAGSADVPAGAARSDRASTQAATLVTRPGSPPGVLRAQLTPG